MWRCAQHSVDIMREHTTSVDSMLALRLSLRSARMVAFAPSTSALGATLEPCYAAWVPVRGAKKGKGGGGGGKKGRDEDAEEAVQLDQLVDMDELAASMEKSMAHFERDLASLRVGRADPRMFDHVKVDAYGEKQPLSSVAQVNIKGAQQLAVNVFDASVRVERASMSPPRLIACSVPACCASSWWAPLPTRFEIAGCSYSHK